MKFSVGLEVLKAEKKNHHC